MRTILLVGLLFCSSLLVAFDNESVNQEPTREAVKKVRTKKFRLKLYENTDPKPKTKKKSKKPYLSSVPTPPSKSPLKNLDGGKRPSNFRNLDKGILQDQDWSQQSFQCAEMTFCNCQGANFTEADLSHVSASSANFKNTNLTKAKLFHAVFFNVDFRGAFIDNDNGERVLISADYLQHLGAFIDEDTRFGEIL